MPRPGTAAICALLAIACGAVPRALPGPADAAPAGPRTIVDEWTAAKAPPAPPLKPVTADPGTTAFLILDVQRQNCASRPRCAATVPRIAALLARATAAGVLVVYSVFPGGHVDDILPEVRPLPGQPLVAAGPDKFLNTNLDAVLRGRNIKTAIVSGTAANGAVLATSSEAAERGFAVAVPLDLMSAEALYAEQYTAWHLSHAPVISPHITLTRSDLIRF